nr:hypothetical protein [Prochloraceae cyanobacterium]
ACRVIDDFLLKNPQMDEKSYVLLFTNKERGCTEQEIEMLKKEIPSLYQGKRFTIWVLPKEYANLPAKEALNYFVKIGVGISEV